MILPLLLTLSASAIDNEELARRALAELQVGRAQRAYELTRTNYQAHPALAAVHVAAAQRHTDPLRVAQICRDVVLLTLRQWPEQRELLRTCGWQLVATRTHRTVAGQAAHQLTQIDPFDNDARGLRVAVAQMDELPRRRWDPPKPKGAVKARRKRDFEYLWRYLRPEDGSVTALGSWLVLPEAAEADAQVRTGVHSTLFLRPHEVVLAGWRGTHTIGGDQSRSFTHQLHGGYRVTLWSKTALQLDGTAIVGKGRDEGALRFRAERTGLGVWSADPAVVWTPWGTHGALQLGWSVNVEGVATMDVRIEGQAGDGGPRALALLGLSRAFGHTTVRLDGQAGRAARPLGDRYLVRDLPGIEGTGATLSLQGRLSKRYHVGAGLGIRRLHTDLGEPGTTVGLLRGRITGGW